MKGLQPKDLSKTYCDYPISDQDKAFLEKLHKELEYNPLTGIFTRLVARSSSKVGDIAGCRTSLGYIHTSLLGKVYNAHRLAWCYFYGVFPEGKIDHINRIRWDNRIVNLRDVSDLENGRNRYVNANNKSGYTGVHYYVKKKKWVARIEDNGKRIHLGYFINKADAIAARKKAEELYGYIAD